MSSSQKRLGHHPRRVETIPGGGAKDPRPLVGGGLDGSGGRRLIFERSCFVAMSSTEWDRVPAGQQMEVMWVKQQ